MSVKPLKGFALVPVDQLHPSPNNIRETLTGIEELAQSIREVGMIQPIIAQRIPGQDGLQIVAGHRRHAAAQRAQIREVPVVVRRDMLPDEELLAMLVENGQRAGLDPVEEARALDKLKRGGLADKEIAQRIGRSPAYVSRRIMLLTLPLEEQEEIRAGHFTASDAEALVRQRRAQERRHIPNAGQLGRPKGRKTTPYFSDQHPLAKTVRAACNHRGTPKVGAVGCGACWEQAIRTDQINVLGLPTAVGQ